MSLLLLLLLECNIVPLLHAAFLYHLLLITIIARRPIPALSRDVTQGKRYTFIG